MTGRLLFLPGVGADPRFWRPLGDLLPAGREKVYLGWPGLGRQAADPGVNGPEDLITLVEAALGDEPCDLLAQSMGGVIAMAVTLRNPGRVRRLVLTATSGGVDVGALGASNWRETYRREHPEAPAWATAPWPDLTTRLSSVVQPTLLIWGDADPISPTAVGERLASLLPSASLRVLPGADHGFVETHADEIAPWIADHLA